MRLEIVPLPVAGEIRPGDDVAGLIAAAAPPLLDGDVIVVTHKAVAKAEGRIVDLASVEPSALALEITSEGGDPRHVEVVLRETRLIVRRRGTLIVSETAHGFICANAGVDRSNAPGFDTVVLLPVDPDASARSIRASLEKASGARLGVIVADTFGRAFRVGIIGTAIGVSGLEPVHDLAGTIDSNGYELRATTVAVADELAAAADLVFGKVERVPAALIRGFGASGDGDARQLAREPAGDLFR